jgi:putative transposase
LFFENSEFIDRLGVSTTFSQSMEQFKSNNNVVFDCKYHVIFCPKYRKKVLVGSIEEDLKRLLHEKAEALRVEIIEMEVMPDHVHLCLSCDPQFGIHRVVKHLKGYTSHALRKTHPVLLKMPSLWTNSYFVATVGSAPLAVLKQYIQNQKNV